MGGGDWLVLEGMQFFGYHGDVAAERELGSRVYVDVELRIDAAPAGRSDHIADALDYVRCYERIRAVVEGERFHLLEEPRAQLARDRVGKEPPLPGQIRRCAVVIERARTVP